MYGNWIISALSVLALYKCHVHTVRDNNFLNLKYAFLGVPELGIRRRAWGRVHLMRSGKRSAAPVSWHPVQSEEMDGPDYDVERSLSSMGVERADLGIGIQPLSSLVLRRVTTWSCFCPDHV